MEEEALLQQALEATEKRLEAKSLQDDPNNPASDRAFLDRVELDKAEGGDGGNILSRTARAIGTGALKAGFETKDFLMGEEPREDHSKFRQDIEAQDRGLRQESAGYGAVSSVSQIAVGLIGAGKLLKPVEWIGKGGKAVKSAYEIGKGMLAGSVVVDPHEERLSDLIEEFPDLSNPVTEYLAADPNDSDAEGRFKNAIESLGLDLTLLLAVRAIKFLKAGKGEEAANEIKRLDAYRKRNAGEYGIDFTDSGPLKEVPEDAVTPQASPAGSITPDVTPPTTGGSAAPTGGNTGDSVGTVPGEPNPTIREQLGTKAPVDTQGNPVVNNPETPNAVFKTEDVTDVELDALTRGARADLDAIEKYGSRSAAIANGHKFGKGAKLSWQKLRSRQDVQAYIQATARVLDARFNKAKGGKVLGDKRVTKLVEEIAETFGGDPSVIMGQIVDAGEGAKNMVANMEAAYLISSRMFMDVAALHKQIRLGDLAEFGGNVEMATAELKARWMAATDLLAAGASMTSNTGRSLRRMRTQFAVTAKDLQRIREIPWDKLDTVLEKAGGDPKKMAMLANPTWAQRVMDEAGWHVTNGLLWLWPTHTVNTTTNALMTIGRPTEKLFGSAALRLITKDPAKRAELGAISRQAMREYQYTATSIAEGWFSMVEAFKRGDSALAPHATEYFEGGAAGIQAAPIQWKPVNNALDLFENGYKALTYRNIVGLPTRSLGAVDEFFKTIRYRAVIQARAAVEATDAGLTGDAFKRYIQKALDDGLDPATGQALDPAVLREAQTVGFQQALDHTTHVGSIGRGVQALRKEVGPMRLVLPFVKTPMNVLRYGVKMTPGLNLLQKEYADSLFGKMGPEAQAHAMGQMALGATFLSWAAMQAAEGRFTGGGPDDYKVRQELVATGWKPYSFVTTDEKGNKTYYQLGRFDPMGMVMGITADIVKQMEKDPDSDYSELILAATIAVAKNIGDKTFLLNLNQLMEAGLDPEANLPKYLGRLSGSALPMSSLIRGHNPDPYLREARGFVDSAIRGIPGLSKRLPPTRDFLGDPIERHVGIWDNEKADVVRAEHNRIMLQTGKGLGKPGTSFEGADLRDIELASGQNAYDRLQELSGQIPGAPSLYDLLERMITSEAYQDLPDGESSIKGTRLNALGVITQQYHQRARKLFIRENIEVLGPLIKARQKAAAGAIIENRKARTEPDQRAQGVLDAIGVTTP